MPTNAQLLTERLVPARGCSPAEANPPGASRKRRPTAVHQLQADGKNAARGDSRKCIAVRSSIEAAFEQNFQVHHLHNHSTSCLPQILRQSHMHHEVDSLGYCMLQPEHLHPWDMADLPYVKAGVAQLLDGRLGAWHDLYPTEPRSNVRRASGQCFLPVDCQISVCVKWCDVRLSAPWCAQMDPMLLPSTAPLEYRVRLHCRVCLNLPGLMHPHHDEHTPCLVCRVAGDPR